MTTLQHDDRLLQLEGRRFYRTDKGELNNIFGSSDNEEEHLYYIGRKSLLSINETYHIIELELDYDTYKVINIDKCLNRVTLTDMIKNGKIKLYGFPKTP